MEDSFSGRIFSYSARGLMPEDVTDKNPSDKCEPLFGCWHGPMACDDCEIVVSAVVPIRSKEEQTDVDVWWKTARENLFPRTMEGELCPKCEKPRLRYYHIEGWYEERYAIDHEES